MADSRKKTEKEPRTADRLADLRLNMAGQNNQLTELLDILIDHHGGDVEEVRGKVTDVVLAAATDAALAGEEEQEVPSGVGAGTGTEPAAE